MNNVLVIGNGGRENAIVISLLSSPNVKNVYIINGNGGTSGVFQRTFNVSNIKHENHEEVLDFIKQNKIELTVVGPEAPLSQGIVDFLEANSCKVFGPNRSAAKLEYSKIFMKDVLVKAGIPTAKYQVFESNQKSQAMEFLKEFQTSAIVIKADGLAAGKGVVICQNKTEAEKEIEEFFSGKFGEAGKKIVIEEFLDGFEISLFGITDGKDVICFGSACDHKRIFDNDLGLNTGGMGTFSPSNLTQKEEFDLTEKLIKPVVTELAKRGIIYKGVLFAGLMICQGEAKVLEFNARFGDPETQSILPRFEGDLYELFERVATQSLQGYKPKFSKKSAVTVVLASKNYPESGSKGGEITLPKTLASDEFIFHAGTFTESGKLFTNGGRILGITALGKTKAEARKKAYNLVSKVNFEGMQFRRDIAEDLISFSINFQEEKWKAKGVGFYDLCKKLLKITLKTHAFKNANFDLSKTYEFSILLTNDSQIQKLNKEHRAKDKPTNVLSFPINEEYEKGKILMGDIAIALETLERESAEQSKTFIEHFSHMFVHSVLHLLSYDHENPDEMKEMEEMEDSILNQIL